jgi:spermidine synthase
VGTEISRTVYENGVVLFTVPDPASAEEAVHYALLEHPSPRSLLLIGGGRNGSIREALRHTSLERVDYVELDPAILELAREYFPEEERTLRADARVHVHIADGRLFVKNTAATFDVVIVNLPDPRNAQLNRFYTAEFFQKVARRLTADGVLALQLRGSENYIGPELGEFLGSIHETLQSVFPAVQAIPGETVHFFAARRAGVLASGAEELLTRLRARNLHTSYVSEYFIPYRMAPDRMVDLEKQFQRSPVNHDFAPIAYYLDVALWTSQFHPGSHGPLGWLAGIPYRSLAWGLGIALAAVVVAVRLAVRPRQRQIVAAGCCTAAAGFNMIGTEMILLLGFQAVYGYVYQQLAVLIAAFMAGMALGSWLAQRRPTPARLLSLADSGDSPGGAGFSLRGASAPPTRNRIIRTSIVSLGVAQLPIAAAPLALAGLIAAMPASAAVFSLAALACGMLGGFEFPLACGVFFGGAKAAGTKRLGALYALDLAGSSVGAIAVSAWLIPVFGFLKTGWLAAMLGLAPALLALSTASGGDPEGTNSPSAPPRTPEP